MLSQTEGSSFNTDERTVIFAKPESKTRCDNSTNHAASRCFNRESATTMGIKTVPHWSRERHLFDGGHEGLSGKVRKRPMKKKNITRVRTSSESPPHPRHVKLGSKMFCKLEAGLATSKC